MTKLPCPRSRTESLVIQELDGEVLVFDMTTNQAHCLNETAGFIWTSCDGRSSISDIADSFKTRFGHAVDPDLVRITIEDLEGRNLVTESGLPATTGISRRDVIRRIALTTACAIPVIASVTAPANAFAASSCLCTTPGDCITQTVCPSQSNCNLSGFCAP